MALLPVLCDHHRGPQPAQRGHHHVAVLDADLEGGVGQAEALAVGDAEKARRFRRLRRACLRRATAARLAAREVEEREAAAGRRLARQRAAHHQLGVVGMRADPGDVEGVHGAILARPSQRQPQPIAAGVASAVPDFVARLAGSARSAWYAAVRGARARAAEAPDRR